MDNNIFEIARQLVIKFNQSNTDVIYIAQDQNHATLMQNYVRFWSRGILNCYLLSSPDVKIYDKFSLSLDVGFDRAKVLGELLFTKDKKLVITPAHNLFSRLADPAFFKKNTILLKPGLLYKPQELASQLVQNGFYRVTTVATTGEFAQRGDIIDVTIFPNQAYRVYFEWDRILEIKTLDLIEQKSVDNIDQLAIFPLSEIVLNKDLLKNFTINFDILGLDQNDQYNYQSILTARKINGIENILPMFFFKLAIITGYLNNPKIFADSDLIASYERFYASASHQFHEISKISKLVSPLEQKIITRFELDQIQVETLTTYDLTQTQNFYFQARRKIQDAKYLFTEFISCNLKNNKIIVAVSNLQNIQRLKDILVSKKINHQDIIDYSHAKINTINIYQDHLPGVVIDNIVIVPDSYIFGMNKPPPAQKAKSSSLENFLLELNSFSIGQIVVHNDYGIAKFLGIEPISVEGAVHDYVKLLYANDDKVYIPVENIELVKKFGDGQPELDKLGSNNWQKRKALLKNKISDIAHKLIKTAAQRKLLQNTPIHINQEHYSEFCSLFPYFETDDQLVAIEDIRDDFVSGKLMERLVCGDVGYGKTEVAMRAAFFILSDDRSKQIAVISPTTVLARQHFDSFKKRFEPLGYKIAHLSRFVAQSEQKQIKQELKLGNINLVIGTHGLFANSVEFKNLGLIIIDEEHLFGVKQKEKLKNISLDAHVLSLSATPIPRTLQMSLVGIRDLSIIATPPFDRLPVKTVIINYDSSLIFDAINRELARGGKIFYVAPKLNDLDQIYQFLRALDNSYRIKIVHGQMPVADLDEILTKFYEGDFDILLSTNIIQSGLDVPLANTIIIHNAHLFGLSQLHQLKGRVGRGNLQGYCYFISDFARIDTISYRRLQIIQSESALGAGFNIASHDIDIRGFGNLLGDEQSGHIKEVGFEMYQDMLKEEIDKINQDKQLQISDDLTPVLNLDLPIYIPDSYITDIDLKLLIYRRIAKMQTQEACASLIDELNDRFGNIPVELENLFGVVALKALCRRMLISNLDLGTKGIVIKFYKQAHVTRMIEFVTKHPKYSKIRPDGAIILFKLIDPNDKISQISKILTTLENFIHAQN